MTLERTEILVQGVVQGIGFRPFVYRLATELGLAGTVKNSAQGVVIEAEGEQPRLAEFLRRLQVEKPGRALIQDVHVRPLCNQGRPGFEICPSAADGERRALVLPDLATCAGCLREIFDPQDRRYLYPFTNCTHCGPRFSIIEALPYDRGHTSMKSFKMCPECEAEYHSPDNRRFHAQPNACPKCGPQLELWDHDGVLLAQAHGALEAGAQAIRAGKILALKGIGGFQLIADARSTDVIERLRARKRRPEKPFALMAPTLDAARALCQVSSLEAKLLTSQEAPIVLLRRDIESASTDGSLISASVAPVNPYLGLMLPYSPLHHLLMRELKLPVVATSGNRSDEPICTEESQALERLRDVADLFLVHNRPIVRSIDDSVARILLDQEVVLRRARGYAPLPVRLKSSGPAILAVGGQLKNTVALRVGRDVLISQHLGDLGTSEAHAAFCKSVQDLPRLYGQSPSLIACDLHPDYHSTNFARTQGIPVLPVQHHYAHVLSCLAENEIEPPALGVAWDGTGYGPDGTIWGGEFLSVTEDSYKRLAHLRPFPLPGGEACIRQPRRSALGMLFELFGPAVFESHRMLLERRFSASELRLLRRMLERGLNAPITSSAGRLFDAVASLAGLRQEATFEGQAAMGLEFAVQEGVEEAYPFIPDGAGSAAGNQPRVLDWGAMVVAMLEDLSRGSSPALIAAKFHNALVAAIVAVAQRAGQPVVALSGGCFQNPRLLEGAVRRLRAAGFHPCWHRRVPANDGGIALGQIVAASSWFRPRPCEQINSNQSYVPGNTR